MNVCISHSAEDLALILSYEYKGDPLPESLTVAEILNKVLTHYNAVSSARVDYRGDDAPDEWARAIVHNAGLR